MRSIVLAAALVALAPLALAQTSTQDQTRVGANNPSGTTASSRYASGQGENCGTPDQFKPCPPLPRHPLPYYPANKRD